MKVRFGKLKATTSAAIIKHALKQVHDDRIPLGDYEEARRSIKSDEKGRYIENGSEVGVLYLLDTAAQIEKDELESKERNWKALFPGNPKAQYTCMCGWEGKGTGRDGALVEGDRCSACGAYL